MVAKTKLDTPKQICRIIGTELINGLVGQRPFEMAYKAMYILKDIVQGKSGVEPIHTGLDVCNNDNVDTCVN